MDKGFLAFHIFLVLSLFFFGWAANELYDDWTMERNLNGLYIHYAENASIAREIAQNIDGGDWVCTNTVGMNYDECVETAQHECAHEVFAEFCEENKNQNKCREFINSMEQSDG